jgi:voltage-gated potassium channel
MIVFVILTQFVGMFFLVLIFPFYVMPYIEERFEVRLPHVLPEMSGRVLFYRYGPAIESLVDEFQRLAAAFVIFEEDMELARNLRTRGYEVVFGKLDEQPDVLAGVESARAVVANADDHANAICILIAREQGFTGPIYALADDPLYRPPMLQVGASEVFTPSHVLAAALAARASTFASARRPRECTCSAASSVWPNSGCARAVHSPDSGSATCACVFVTA